MQTINLLKLAITLLTQDEGVPEDAYALLRDMLEEEGLGRFLAHVDAVDGRYFLPEKLGGTRLILLNTALSLFGIGVAGEHDSEGQVVLYTGIYEKE